MDRVTLELELPMANRWTTMQTSEGDPMEVRRRSIWGLSGTGQDGQTEQRRARARVLRSGILTSLISRSVAALAPVALVPITLGYLGKEVYGLWMAIASLTSMVLWADFGLGNGLMTGLARSRAQRDAEDARRQISTTYAILGVGSLMLIALLWCVAGVIPWHTLLSITDPQLETTARRTALICISAFAITIPLSIIVRVQYAFQQVSASNLWQAAGSMASVALAWICIRLGLDTTLVVAAAVSGPPIVNILNSVWVYLGPLAEIAPKVRSVNRATAKGLSRLGGQFFVISILSSVAMNADNFVIAKTLGLSAVTDLAVPAKLFTALGLVVTLINLPLWAAIGDALARSDHEWVRSATRRMTLLSGGAVVLLSAILLAFGRSIFSVWVGDNVRTQPSLLIFLAVWWLLIATASPRFMVQNASGEVRIQIVGWIAFFLLVLPLKWFAAQTLGIPAVAAAGALCYAAILWPTAAVGYNRVMRAREVGCERP